jgi:hypothetical protein
MLIELINGLLYKKKKLNINKFPSQGFFYNKDMKIFIKRAKEEEIVFYKNNLNTKNIANVIYNIKKIVKHNTIFSSNYIFDDLKSIDIIFIFLEIVKHTKNKKIFINDINFKEEIEFSSKNFKYFFNIDNTLINNYNSDERLFLIDGYKFSLPTIGVENSLTSFLIRKIDEEKQQKYINYYYDFTYFLGQKNRISDIEIENLIQIFNFELEEEESKKIRKIIDTFIPIQTYQLLYKNKVIELTSKINLNNIWD